MWCCDVLRCDYVGIVSDDVGGVPGCVMPFGDVVMCGNHMW